MADEAFALSPISARAVAPGGGYAAISEAFMETSRGRWSSPNTPSATATPTRKMVLDAVATRQALPRSREEGLATQKQAAADAAEINLAEAFAAIRGAVEAAQASATEALDGLALKQKLAPLRKGARVIREISWRLREIGNDGRFCDLINSQVTVIENGAGQIFSDEAKAALNAAFASIADRLAGFGDADEAPAVIAAAPAAFADEAQVAPAAEVFEASIATAASTSEATSAEGRVAETADKAATGSEAAQASFAEAALAEAEAADLAQVTGVAADAHDEAVLDMVAIEMGAPEPFDIDDTAAIIVEEAHIAPQAPAEPEMMAQAPEPIAAPAEPPAETPPRAAIAPKRPAGFVGSIASSTRRRRAVHSSMATTRSESRKQKRRGFCLARMASRFIATTYQQLRHFLKVAGSGRTRCSRSITSQTVQHHVTRTGETIPAVGLRQNRTAADSLLGNFLKEQLLPLPFFIHRIARGREANMAKTPQVGEQAPDFELPGTDGPFQAVRAPRRARRAAVLPGRQHDGLHETVLLLPRPRRRLRLAQRDGGRHLLAGSGLARGVRRQARPQRAAAGRRRQGASPRPTAPLARRLGTKRAVIVIDEQGVVRHRHDHLLGLDYQSVDDLKAALDELG